MATKPKVGIRAASGAERKSKARFGGVGSDGPRSLVVLDDGEYELELTGARVIFPKNGKSEMVDVELTDPETGSVVNTSPLLVWSSGGSSKMTMQNQALLVQMAGIQPGDEVDAEGLCERLSSGRVLVELRVQPHYQNGTPENGIVAAERIEEGAPQTAESTVE